MKNYFYLFTTDDAKELIHVQACSGLGTEAQDIRRDLSEKYQKPIVAWCCMGGDNPPVRL